MIDVTTLFEPLISLGQLSLFKHAFDAGMIAVWRDIALVCDAGEACDHSDGEDVLRSYKIGVDRSIEAHLTRALLMMAALSVVTRLLGYARLWNACLNVDAVRLPRSVSRFGLHDGTPP